MKNPRTPLGSILLPVLSIRLLRDFAVKCGKLCASRERRSMAWTLLKTKIVPSVGGAKDVASNAKGRKTPPSSKERSESPELINEQPWRQGLMP